VNRNRTRRRGRGVFRDLRGRVELFSADALIDMLARLGIKVRLVASTRRRVA
jgi:predicted XRE-type DNA-binding protein